MLYVILPIEQMIDAKECAKGLTRSFEKKDLINNNNNNVKEKFY